MLLATNAEEDAQSWSTASAASDREVAAAKPSAPRRGTRSREGCRSRLPKEAFRSLRSGSGEPTASQPSDPVGQLRAVAETEEAQKTRASWYSRFGKARCGTRGPSRTFQT